MSAQGKYKGFFHSYDGTDEFAVTFGWAEEEAAFRAAARLLSEAINQCTAHGQNPRQKPLERVSFRTTLQSQVVRSYVNEFKKVVGLSVLNTQGENDFYVVPLPALPASE